MKYANYLMVAVLGTGMGVTATSLVLWTTALTTTAWSQQDLKTQAENARTRADQSYAKLNERQQTVEFNREATMNTYSKVTSDRSVTNVTDEKDKKDFDDNYMAGASHVNQGDIGYNDLKAYRSLGIDQYGHGQGAYQIWDYQKALYWYSLADRSWATGYDRGGNALYYYGQADMSFAACNAILDKYP